MNAGESVSHYRVEGSRIQTLNAYRRNVGACLNHRITPSFRIPIWK